MTCKNAIPFKLNRTVKIKCRCDENNCQWYIHKIKESIHDILSKVLIKKFNVANLDCNPLTRGE